MAFRRFSKTYSKRAEVLRNRARVYARSPDDLKLPVRSSDKSKSVAKFFNSFALPDHQQFTLKALGKPFNYHGVLTKQYDVQTMLRLFLVCRETLYRWIRNGYLPEPFLRVVGRANKVYWLYHQVQPFYTWYWNRKGRGLRLGRPSPEDMKILKKQLKRQERRWYARIEVPYIDQYTRIAGKYGVIYPKEY